MTEQPTNSAGVVEVDLIRGNVLLVDGQLLPITDYMDIESQPNSPPEAFSAIAGPTIQGKFVRAVVTNNEREKLREHRLKQIRLVDEAAR